MLFCISLDCIDFVVLRFSILYMLYFVMLYYRTYAYFGTLCNVVTELRSATSISV